MRAKGVIYVLIAAVIAVFVVANWGLLMGPVEMDLLVARVQAPLAVLILLFAGVILLLDLSVHALGEYAWMRDRRALARDLEAARLRADKVEESRTADLKRAVESELATIRAQLDRVLATQSTLLGRVPVVAGAEIARPSGALEPELISPRDPRARDAH